MEEFDRIESGIKIKTDAYKRTMMIVFALVGVLVLAGAGLLVYFYKSASSVDDANSAESNVVRDGKPKIEGISFGSKGINSRNPENESISHGSINIETEKPVHLVLDENDDSTDESTTLDSVPNSSLGFSNIANEQPVTKDQFFFEMTANFNIYKTIIRLNDDGIFSERFQIDLPEGNSEFRALFQISQSAETICMAVDRKNDIQIYTADLKTKRLLENILTVPYERDKVGDPAIHFSPDCESFAYYFEKYCKENGSVVKSNVILRNLKTGDQNDFDWGTGKDQEIILRNGGRVIRNSYLEGNKSIEVSLLSKENNYKGEKLFVFQDCCICVENNFQVSEDASRILYVEAKKNPTGQCQNEINSFIFDVSSEPASDFGTFTFMPLMSIDGKKIAFYEKTSGEKTKVKIIDVETTKTENEIELEGNHDLYSWSNNCKFLFFDSTDLKKLSITDRDFEPVKDKYGMNLWISLQ